MMAGDCGEGAAGPLAVASFDATLGRGRGSGVRAVCGAGVRADGAFAIRMFGIVRGGTSPDEESRPACGADGGSVLS